MERTQTVSLTAFELLNARYEEALAANATYKHLWRAAEHLTDAWGQDDQEGIDSALSGIRQIIEAAEDHG